MAASGVTPMMRQYYKIKEQHRDCILFFRLGDFYEMFSDDARLASKELDLTLTSRDRSKEKSDEDRDPGGYKPFAAFASCVSSPRRKLQNKHRRGDGGEQDPQAQPELLPPVQDIR